MKSISKIKVLFAAVAAGVVGFISFAACGAEVVIDPGVGVEASPEKISGTTDVTIKSGIVTMDPANDYTGTTSVSGATVIASSLANSGTASSFGSSGAVGFDRAVLKYTGPAVTTDRQLWNSTYSVGTADRLQVWDIASDVTLASAMTSSDGLIKLGAGTLTFNKKLTLNVGDVTLSDVAKQFVLPNDGTGPSTGLSLFGIYGGEVVLENGAAIAQNNNNVYCFIGGWTADQGGAEPDVQLTVRNGGTSAYSTSGYMGQLHGFKDFNTPDHPAKAYLVVEKGATFQQGGGKGFYMGAYSSAPSGKTYNTDLRIILNGGTFTHSTSYAGFQVYQRPGQVNRILMDGGTFRDYVVEVGGGVTSGDTTATLLVDLKNGATLNNGKWINNTAKVTSQPAVQVNITGGSAFYTQLLKSSDASKPGNMSIYIDDGTLGVYNATLNSSSHKDLWVQRKLIAPAGLVKLELGEGGATLIAQGTSVTDTLPNTAVYEKGFSTAETLVAAGKKDGGLTITGQTVDHVVELSGASTYTGPTVVKSGTLLLTGDGDISSSEIVTVKNNANLLVSEKDVTLANAVFETGAILTVWKGHKLIITGTVEFEPGVNIVLRNADGTEVTDAEEFSFIQVPADQKEKLSIIGLKGLFGSNFYFQSTAFDEEGGNATFKAVIAPRIDRDDDPEGEATWTGEGADKNLTTDANWQGGAAPSFAGGTLATFGKTDSAVVANEKAFRGLHIGDNSFTFDGDNEFAFILLKAAGLTFETPQEGANNLIKFNAGIQSEVAQTLDIPAGDTVEIAGDSAFAKALTVTGGGTLALTAPHSKFGPLLLNKDQTHKVIFSGMIDNLDGTITTSASSSESNAGTIQLTSSSTGSDALGNQVNILSNAVIRKAMYCTEHTSGGRMLYAAAGTTNILQGAWYSTSPQAYITAAKDSELIFDGGTYFGWSTHMGGSGRIIFRKKLTIGGGRLLTPGAGTLRFEATGNSWNERLTVNSTGMRIEYAVDDAFTQNGYLDLAESNVYATNEFFKTVQHFNQVHTANSERHCLRGDYGSKIVITGGCKANAAAWGTTNIACRVEGGLSLEADGTGDLILSTRSFASCGDLIATKGALRLENGAKWLNGTNFVMRGEGVMKFTAAGQVGAGIACFRFSENGKVNLADDFTLSVRRATVDDGSGEVAVPQGVYDKDSTGLMAGRITGDGKLMVTYAETTEDMTAQGDWVVDVAEGCTQAVTVPQTGAGKITKTGKGTLVFLTENTYTGGTVIEKGVVRVETSNVFGTGEVTILGQRADYTGVCRIDMIGCPAKNSDLTFRTTITNDIHIAGDTTPTYPFVVSYHNGCRLLGKITADHDFCFLEDEATMYAITKSYFDTWENVTSLTFGEVEAAGMLRHDGWATFDFTGDASFGSAYVNTYRTENYNRNTHYNFKGATSFGVITNQARSMTFSGGLTVPDVIYGLTGGDGSGTLTVRGADQSVGGFSDPERAASDTSHDYTSSGATTLTITGITPETPTELTTYYRFDGALSIILDASDNFTQVFANRANGMTGGITVKKGTFKMAGTSKFANLTSLSVEAGAAFIDESTEANSIAGLKNLTLVTGSTLVLPAGTKLNLTSLTLDGVKQVPANGYTHATNPLIPEGVTINVTSVQPATTVAVWTGAGDDTKMSNMGNWLVNGEVPTSLDLTSGATTVSIEGGTEMIPDIDGVRLHSITNNRAVDAAVPIFYLGAAGRMLCVDGQIISDQKAALGLRGIIAGGNGTLQTFNPDENGACVITWKNGGDNRALYFAGVTLKKPVYLQATDTGLRPFIGAANTTNILLCAARVGGSANNKPKVEAGGVVEFAGGCTQVNRPMKIGDGTMKFSGVPVSMNNGYSVDAGTFEIACPSNAFKAQGDNTLNCGIRIGASSAATLKFDCSYGLADNDLEQIDLRGAAKAIVDLSCTTQVVSRFCGNNTHAQSVLTGEAGSMLEVKGGTKWTKAAYFIGLTNSVQIAGGLGFHYLGNGPAKDGIAPAGADDVYVLKGKAFATTGNLEVSGGTLELAEDATWKNGQCFVADGEGLLRFTAEGQVGAQAMFRFAGNGKIEIPAGVTYRCTAIDVEGYEPIETGVFDKNSTGAMAGRIIGDGSLKVGRRGTMLIVQ